MPLGSLAGLGGPFGVVSLQKSPCSSHLGGHTSGRYCLSSPRQEIFYIFLVRSRKVDGTEAVADWKESRHQHTNGSHVLLHRLGWKPLLRTCSIEKRSVRLKLFVITGIINTTTAIITIGVETKRKGIIYCQIREVSSICCILIVLWLKCPFSVAKYRLILNVTV